MSGLKAFMRQNVVPEESVHFAASPRFLDEKGEPVLWEIRGITSAQDDALRNDCYVRSKKKGTIPDFDSSKYMGLMAASCTVFPNLLDAELQDDYGVKKPDDLLRAMLKPGEYARYIQKVQEVNGFDQTMEELVEEAKN